jgi:hypothetical protein
MMKAFAFLRLAWAKTQEFLEIPEIWRAVCAVSDGLFSGLAINSRPFPWKGDVFQYAMPGHVAEYFMATAGVTFGMLREEHSCAGAPAFGAGRSQSVGGRVLKARFWRLRNNRSCKPEGLITQLR